MMPSRESRRLAEFGVTREERTETYPCIINARNKWVVYLSAAITGVLVLVGAYLVLVYALTPVQTILVITMVVGCGVVAVLMVAFFFKSPVSEK